jgi:hypothetical protein
VETRLRLRFTKGQPIAFQLLEFLAQSTSSTVWTLALHIDSLLVNEYATAMPLIWFSGIIYSEKLVMSALQHVSSPIIRNNANGSFRQYGDPHYPLSNIRIAIILTNSGWSIWMERRANPTWVNSTFYKRKASTIKKRC